MDSFLQILYLSDANLYNDNNIYALWGHILHLISAQLFGPTGSRKQLDIAITAASMDASSPCFQGIM